MSLAPALGPIPAFARAQVAQPTELSIAAEKIAALVTRGSILGRNGDPWIPVEKLMTDTGLCEQDLEVAVSQLERARLVEPARAAGCSRLGYVAVQATDITFLELDPVFMGTDPRADGVRLVVELLNTAARWLAASDACERLEWTPRRINPALAYLISEDAVMVGGDVHATFIKTGIHQNNNTLAFAREHSG